jgi:DedD protein
MLLTREDELRQVRVDAPQTLPLKYRMSLELQPVVVPEAQLRRMSRLVLTLCRAGVGRGSSEPAVLQHLLQVATPAQSAPASWMPATRSAGRCNWLAYPASMAPRYLPKTLRGQGYNAYIRTVDAMNRRVFVGPLIRAC